MNRAGAVLVMSVFAALWWMVGAAQTGHVAGLSAGGLLVSGFLVAIARRQGDRSASRGERARRGRLVGVASGVEGVAIVLAVVVLHRLGRGDLTAPVIAMIVGLHFLPLARGIPAPIYYLTGGLLVAVGTAGLLIPDPTDRVLLVGLGAAIALWCSCGVVLMRAARPDR